jgi:histidyl-tRNA synthetase
MDIWGVEGVEAEAELLSAIVQTFKDMGITSADVGIKVNSRKILTELMSTLGVPEDKFAPTCVLVDKLEKVPLDAIEGDLKALGLTKEVVLELVAALQVGAALRCSRPRQTCFLLLTRACLPRSKTLANLVSGWARPRKVWLTSAV